MNEENKKKFIDLDGLSHVFSKLSLMFNKKVDKIEGKGLSTNDLTDELKNKILNAENSSFSGNYNDLINKPDLTVYAEKTQVATDISNAVSNKVTESQVNAIVQNVVGAAPEALDTLKEIADALGNDENFASTITTELSKKVNASDIVAITNEEIDAIFEG